MKEQSDTQTQMHAHVCENFTFIYIPRYENSSMWPCGSNILLLIYIEANTKKLANRMKHMQAYIDIRNHLRKLLFSIPRLYLLFIIIVTRCIMSTYVQNIAEKILKSIMTYKTMRERERNSKAN